MIVVLLIALGGAIFFRRRAVGRWGQRSSNEFITISVVAFGIAEVSRYTGLHSNAKVASLLLIILVITFWLTKGFNEFFEAGPRTFGRRGMFSGLYVLIIGCLFIVSVFFKKLIAEDKALYLFLGFLPLVNAIFDFASLGLTRYCLRRSLRPGFLVSLKWSLIDALAACALFTGLVLAAILIVHLVRDGNGDPLTNLNVIFKGIAEAPNAYWWLYLTFFSTLIPTLLHLGIASFGFIALAPAPLQRELVRWIGAMDRNGFANLGARYVLPLIATLSIALPFLALYTLGLWITEYHDDFGQGFFRLALGFAEWLDPKYVQGVDAILSGKSGS